MLCLIEFAEHRFAYHGWCPALTHFVIVPAVHTLSLHCTNRRIFFRLDGNYLPCYRWYSRVCLCPSSISSSLNILCNLNKSWRSYLASYMWSSSNILCIPNIHDILSRQVFNCIQQPLLPEALNHAIPPHMYLGSTGVGRIQTWGR